MVREHIRRIFGSRKPVSPEKSPEEYPYGFIKLEGFQVPLTGQSILVGSYRDPIEGEIPSNIIGLVCSHNADISLVIGESPEGAVPQKDGESPQKIGATDIIDSEAIHLAPSYSEASIESNQQQKRMDELITELKRLQVGQTTEALRIQAQFLAKQKGLQSSEASLREHRDEAFKKLEEIKRQAAQQLTIRSFNGNITLGIKDPNLEVVVSPEFNYRDSSFPNGGDIIISGEPPANSLAQIRVFTYRGKISITYPARNVQV